MVRNSYSCAPRCAGIPFSAFWMKIDNEEKGVIAVTDKEGTITVTCPDVSGGTEYQIALKNFTGTSTPQNGTSVFRSTLLMVSVVPVADTVSNDGDFKAPRAATRGSEYAYFLSCVLCTLVHMIWSSAIPSSVLKSADTV